MKNINITDARQRFSDYINYVLSGGTVLLWKRKKLVAKIIPSYSEQHDENDSELWQMVNNGLLRTPTNNNLNNLFSNLSATPKTKVNLSDIISADRDE